MNTRVVGRRLRRYLWIPIALTIVAVAASAVLVAHSPPEYVATATVVANSPPSGVEKTLNLADIATSNNVALNVKKQLGLGEDVDSLLNKIEVTSGRSNLYSITARDADRQRATRIANAFAKEAASLYVQLRSGMPATALAQIEKDRQSYQQQHLDASRALADFNWSHPGVLLAVNQWQASSGARPDGSSPTPPPVDPALAAQALQLQLRQRAAAEGYVRFEERATQARVDQLNAQRSVDAVVVDQAAARPDLARSRIRVLFAGGLALVVGSALLLLLERRDRSVRSAAEVEQMLDVPVLATVPRGNRRSLRPVT
jgi:capsular polysaccharide biosynthesis protein